MIGSARHPDGAGPAALPIEWSLAAKLLPVVLSLTAQIPSTRRHVDQSPTFDSPGEGRGASRQHGPCRKVDMLDGAELRDASAS
jgi:hypothetical protein